MAVRNVTTSDGVYTYSEYGNTYKYYAESRCLYMVTYFKGDPSLHFEREIVSDVQHQQLLDKLNGDQNNPVIPVITNPPPSLDPGTELPVLPAPKYVPDPEGMILGRVPQTVQFRVRGIGVVPAINPVIMDRSYRPKKFSFKDMPDSPAELQEYVRQVVSQGMGKILRQPMGQGPIGQIWERR